MKISRKSIMGRYIQWLDKVYCVEPEDGLSGYRSMCPLFWITICLTLMLPMLAVVKVLIKLFKRPMIWLFDRLYYWNIGRLVKPILALLGLVVIALVGRMVYVVGFMYFMAVFGCFVAFIVCGVLLIIGMAKLWNDTSVGEFIGSGVTSIKDGICPLIFWED